MAPSATRRMIEHMRSLHIVLALGLVFSNAAPVMAGGTPAAEAPKGSDDSVVDFLLTSAATDFHEHRPPGLQQFRKVRAGHSVDAAGASHHLLCGEYQATSSGGKLEWLPFVTLKTSGYEQWLGPDAGDKCRRPGITWDKTGDLSSSLQKRLDALR